MSESTSKNSFNAKSTLEVAGNSYEIFEITGLEGAATLPFSLKVLLENLLRTEDGANITASQIQSLAQWDPTVEPDTEIQFCSCDHARFHWSSVHRGSRDNA